VNFKENSEHIDSSQRNNCCMYYLLLTFKISAFCTHTKQLCVLYDSQNQQLLITCTALTGWSWQ